MDAIEFSEPQRITVIDRPDEGPPGPGQALVRTHRMGICGTDLSCYLGKFPFFAYPRTPGHELGLEVVAVGEGVTHVKPGDKCSLEPYVNDPDSPASRKGANFSAQPRKSSASPRLRLRRCPQPYRARCCRSPASANRSPSTWCAQNTPART